MKKTWLLFLMLILIKTIAAQQVDMELFSVQDKVFKNPVLIGKVGSHYMVMDELGKWPTLIYTFDSSFKLVNTTQEYISSSKVKVTVSDNTVNIIWKTWVRDTLSLSVVKLDENGNEMWFNAGKFYFPVKYASAPMLVTDMGQRYFFYYSLSQDGFNHDRIHGVLLDSNWSEVKTIDHSFDYDNKQFTIASPLVDANGHIYMTVFDKLSNYHLSATVTIHRFPLSNDTVIAKSFQFEQTKFHEFDFKEDADRQSIKLTGFYYDGQLRNKKGIAELIFSNKGNDLLASHFYEFPAELSEELRANMRYTRKKDDPTENLRLKDIFEKKGSLVFSTWLIDIPSYQLEMDKNIGKEDPKEEKKKKKHDKGGSAAALTNPSVDGLLNNSKNFNASFTPLRAPDPRNPGVLEPSGYTNVYTSPVGQPLRSTSTSSPFDDLMGENKNLREAILVYEQNQSSKNLVYFSIDSLGKYKYQVIPHNRFYGPASINFNNYPLVHNEHFLFLNNNVQIDGTIKKMPVTKKTVEVLKYDKTAKPSTLASFGIEEFTILSQPIAIAPGVYLSVFRKRYLVESGLAVWKISEK
jgi:hypothetical protein